MMVDYYACEIVVFGLDIKYNTGHISIRKITINLFKPTDYVMHEQV